MNDITVEESPAALARTAARVALHTPHPDPAGLHAVEAAGLGRAADHRARQARMVLELWEEVLALEEERSRAAWRVWDAAFARQEVGRG